MVEQLSVVGRRSPRKVARRIVTGRLEYYSDVSMKDMLYMSILRSPYAHARIKSIDTTKAEAMPGVRGVITHKDVPETFLSYPDLVRILNDKVFYCGCEVAALVADSQEIADEATELIKVEYEPLAVLLEPEEAMKPGAPEIHDGTPNLLFGQPVLVERGNVEAAFAQADQVVEGDYFTGAPFSSALENHGTVVYWDPDDNVTIRTGTQAPFETRNVFASALGLPLSKLRLIQHPMGGGFGGKSYHLRHHGIAALLSKKTGRPVKFVGWTEDERTRANVRHAGKYHTKMGAKKDGTLTAAQVTCYYNGGAYFADTLATHYVGIAAWDLYSFPNFSWKGYPVYTTRATAGAVRGYGNPQGHWVLEQDVDIMAEALGMDPIQIRKKNHVRAGDPFGAAGKILGSEALDECIDRGAEAISWKDKWRGFGTPYLTQGSKRRAVGFATCHHVGAYGEDAVVVKLQQDGSAQVLSGAAPAGQGIDTVIPMICAEALRLPYERVSAIFGDTAAAPYCSESVSSRVTCTNGNAAKLACEDALRQLFEAAAVLLKVKPEELDAKDGEVFVKANPGVKASYAKVIGNVSPLVFVGVGYWVPPKDYAIEGFAAQFADLEVDVETGEVKVLKMVAAHDVGKAVNPNTLETQIIGGIQSLGIGHALKEEFIIDKYTGKVLNLNLIDNAIPTALDAPEVQCIIVESYEPRGPFGAKGCGEMIVVACSAAISNAVYNAIGVRVTEFPFSPNRILKALGKA